MENEHLDILSLVEKFNSMNIKKLNKKVLEDIDNNKSVFRWSGQFPPKLIEYLLNEYSEKNTVVLDPFCGSGTVVFEAAKKNLEAFGFDINPAAVEISSLATFSNITQEKRLEYLKQIEKIIFELIGKFTFPMNKKEKLRKEDFDIIKITLNEIKDKILLNIFTNILMRFSIIKDKYTISGLLESYDINKKIIEDIPFSKKKIIVKKLNSKKLPIKNKMINLCITSPPYPGVFDYYKNYKKIMYLKNWNISEISQEEIGHNNKGNEVENLLKYSEEIIKTFKEINRVLNNEGRFILIVNEEVELKNKVIKNSLLLYLLALISGFGLVEKYERLYKNRNNKISVENIFYFDRQDILLDEISINDILNLILKS